MQTLLELDAEDPGSIDPELAAHICGHDRELVLALIKENSEQEIAWREPRDHALVASTRRRPKSPNTRCDTPSAWCPCCDAPSD